MRHNKFNGFSLAEMLLVVTFIGVITVSTLPVMSVKKQSGEQEINSIKCIKAEAGDNTSTASCTESKKLCKYDDNQACNTLISYANNGTTDQKNKARKVLSEICSDGGDVACKYFVSSCQKDNYTCDIISGTPDTYNYDMNYFLALDRDSANIGKEKVLANAKGLYLAGNANILNAVNNACYINYNSTACEFLSDSCKNPTDNACKNVICSEGDFCSNVVSDCNSGNNAACKIGYQSYINRSCKQIKDKTATTASGIFKLTAASGDNGNYFDAYCDMTTDGGGWTLVALNNYETSPSTNIRPGWNDAINSITYVGTLSADLTTFDMLMGIKYWNLMGSDLDCTISNNCYFRYQTGNSPTDLTHRATYKFYINPATYYSIHLSSQVVNISTTGTATSGLYSGHNGWPLTTYDADHDSNSGNCATYYGNSPWWYTSCWSGNFWGGGTGGGYANAPYWYSSGSENFRHGSMWIR